MEILTTWVSRELTSELTTLAGTPNSAGIENQRCWWYVAGIRQRYV